MSDAECRMQNAGCRMQDAGCRMPDAGWNSRGRLHRNSTSDIRHPSKGLSPRIVAGTVLFHDPRHISGRPREVAWRQDPVALPRTFIPLTPVPVSSPTGPRAVSATAGTRTSTKTGPRAGTRKLRKPFTRRRPGHEQLIRQSAQLAFLLLN